MNALQDRILVLAGVAQHDLDELYRSQAQLTPASPLNQFGLRDGVAIVEDYLQHTEFGLAFEHLVYMLVEPGLTLTRAQFDELATIGDELGLTSALWERVEIRELD